MKRVMFISSMGGHLSEMMQLSSIFKDYDYKIVTEKHKSTMSIKDKYKNRVDYLMTGNRKNMFKYAFTLPCNIVKSFIIFLKFKPEVVITTGAHTCVAMCYIAKIFRKKVIYIESFANISTKTLTGRLVYPIADTFIVQWESMLKLYPKATYKGWIF
ncbi:MAG: PssD/Cps14F family polysaccharide biosynthesis glycosyltransferase [Bacilli bacterium]